MPSFWSGKKDPGEADRPELFEASDDRTPRGGESGNLDTLAEGLGSLGQLLGRVNHQITAYLSRKEADTAGGTATLGAKIDALAKRLDAMAAGGSSIPAAEGPPSLPGEKPTAPPAPTASVQATLERFEKKLDALAEGPSAASGDAADETVRNLRRDLEETRRQLAERQAASAKKAASAPRAASAAWERAIVGPGLTENPALDFQRQQLVRGVLDGDPAACSMAGQLLVFQSAQAERMPQLLKDIGEAYYRWQPKIQPGANPMEQALVASLKAVCEKAGIGNTIELVHPGERFDSTRHTATTRGVEITEVRGWIVLRDNGKVYTKANVAAR